MVKPRPSPYPSPPTGLRGWVFDLHFAIAFLTRLPLPPLPRMADGALARVMRLFPVAGAGIGLFGAAVYALALWARMTPWLAALLAVAAMVRATGGLHEDGLADTADGFGAGGTRARRMEIMRDSRIGTYGVLALIFSVTLRAGAIAAIAEPHAVMLALVVTGALSRAAMPLAMRMMAPARNDGLGAAAARLDDEEAFAATVIAVASALVLTVVVFPPGPAVVSILAMLGATVAVSLSARAHIGGYTGDVLGAAGQAVEAAVLLALAAAGAAQGAVSS
ncbi:MAG: adenosylcobinamide-GDP ribazoletransferase [Alphaproteobacteria bacterium]